MSHEFSNAIDMTEDDIFKPNLISQVPPEVSYYFVLYIYVVYF